ncbi:filamentous hemagglutinin outer membrane protein (plasmid) [Calothrix sp. NIES-4071]|nr:filamentous hemagglutinin outer membrane protein [Calothrix sp. NIES-4071]BAZ64821.1 filamentous hemagglutinin outer membrane protein [Calothrix sp. NIES-4105]
MTGVSIRLYWWQIEIAIASAITLYTNSSVAQITPDATLPNNSNVTLEGNTFNITGGSTAGGNLFHSFKDFSIPTGSGATFNNAIDIQNIISRVTGKSISNIDGLIKANGGANLFLINPNGIIFGQNARLDIGGSFLATSASSIKFGDSFEFSAVNTESKPLLTVTAPVGLQFGANPGLIQVQGNGQGARNFNSPIIDTQSDLRVQPDKTLALVGGDINLEGATLKTAGGRIELGSVAGNNLVSLTLANKGFALGYSGVQNFGNIQLSQRATVDASGEGGGDIQVQGRRITVTNRSQIQTSTLGAKQGGDLVVNATESLEASISSSLIANAYQKATGNAGNVKINTRELLLIDRATMGAFTFGAGKGGNLTVEAQDIQLIGTLAENPNATGLSVSAQPNSTGDAGSLTIKTNTLLVQDGAQVSAVSSGTGKAGSLSVDAQDIQLIGTTANGRFPSGLGVSADESLTGDAGSLKIKTNTLLVQDGAQVSAATFGVGKGGSLSVNAQDIQLIGRGVNNRLPSALGTSAQQNSTGDAGDLTITTNTLLLHSGAEVSTDTFGAGKGGNLNVDAQDIQLIGRSTANHPSRLGASAMPNSTGDAGSLTIKTNTLLVRDGAQVTAFTSGAGKGGSLSVDAQDIQLIGTTANGRFASVLAASVLPNSTGDAGSLKIKTNTLLLRSGAQVSTATAGAGKGGSLSVDAQDIQLIGRSVNNQLPSTLAASTLPNSTGDAGDLTIKTNTLLVRDGAAVLTVTLGSGKGGFLSVDAQDIQLIGKSVDNQFSSGLGASAMLNSTGDAGNLTIKTNTLLVQDGAGVYVESSGTGTAGNLTIGANSINLDQKALLTANTRSNRTDVTQATININSRDLILRRNSSITTNARGTQVIGGDININTDVLGAFENSKITANSDNFRGGNINIITQGLFLSPDSEITASGATSALNGNINITTLIEPSRGLVEIPINLVDASNQISNACTPGNPKFDSTFTVTGRSGLPISPYEQLQDQSTNSAWVRFQAKPENPNAVRINKPDLIAAAPTIIEASGWIADKSGNIELVAPASRSLQTSNSVSCFELKPQAPQN